MGTCSCHPEIETNYLCMKHNDYLCGECLKCRDPELYCKFRSSCPIWFLQKKGIDAWTDEKEKGRDEKPAYRVIFKPDNREVSVPEVSTLLEAAVSADVHLNASCNGKGSCGKCKLIVESGQFESKPSALLSESEKEKNMCWHVRAACSAI
jgi:ferredoxin